MLEKFRERRNEESGFTLVELLVVMLILGILAAIAIPAFFSQRDKGYDSDAKADVRSAQTAMETYAVDNDGEYLGADQTALAAIEPTISDIDGMEVTATADTYTIAVVSDSDTEFSVSRAATGSVTNDCDAPGEGGCNADGEW